MPIPTNSIIPNPQPTNLSLRASRTGATSVSFPRKRDSIFSSSFHFCLLPFAFCLLLLTIGCQSTPPPDSAQPSPDPIQRRIQTLERLPTVNTVEPWPLPDFITDRSTPGLHLTTNHYRIYTTLTDPLILRQLPVLLESAFQNYTQILGRSLHTDKKLLVYFFAARPQWEQFTRHWTADHAPNYLKITAGAYYFNGATVAYHLGRHANFSVLLHEGWHQFSDELFQFRLPAWLDEGLATNFEAFQWDNGTVQFNPKLNASRLLGLKQSLASGNFFPLTDLLALDAGRILSHSAQDPTDTTANPHIVAYYSQVYCLVRFLREYQYGIYLEKLQTLLEDARTGQWPIDPDLQQEARQRQQNPTRRWNAAVGSFIFRHYLSDEPQFLDDPYRDFCQKILARTRFKKRI